MIMKNIFKSLFALVVGAAFAASCAKEAAEPLAASISVDQATVTIAATGTLSTDVNVTADGDWFATIIDCDWLSVYPTSGSGAAKVSIRATENVDDVYYEVEGPRSGAVSFVGADGAVATVAVNQIGEGGLDASRSYSLVQKEEDLDFTRGMLLVGIYNDELYAPAVCGATDSYYSYIYGAKVEADENGVIARPNASLAYSVEQVEVGDDEIKYALRQPNGKYLIHSTGYDSFYATDNLAGAELWDLEFDEQGHAVFTGDEGCFAILVYNGTVEFTGRASKASVDPNYLPCIYMDSKEATDEVLVVADTVTVAAIDTVATIAVTASKDWTVRNHDAWIDEFTAAGSQDGVVEVSFDMNLDYDNAREASFLVLGQTTSATVVLVQEKYVPYLEVSATAVSAEAEDTTATFTVTSNVDWVVKCAEGVTATPSKGFGSAKVTLNFKANDTEDEIITEIQLSSEEEKLEVGSLSLLLTQKAAGEMELPYGETFAESIGEFSIKDVETDGLDYVWSYAGEQYGMKASAYVNKVNHPTESWLQSPAINLKDAASCQISFSVCGNYGTSGAYDESLSLAVKDVESGAVESVSIGFGSYAGKWEWLDKTIDLSAFAGKKVKVAFVYKSTASVAATMEVKNVSFDLKANTYAEFFASAKNTPVVLDGTVCFAYNKGFFITDGQTQALVYVGAAHDYVVGDVVRVSGKVGVYSNQKQLASPVVTLKSQGASVDYPTAIAIDAAAAAEFSASNPGNQYSTVTLDLSAAKNFEGTVRGGDTLVTLYYATGVKAPEAGSSIVAEGYVYGWFNRMYLYVRSFKAADAPVEYKSIAEVCALATSTEAAFDVNVKDALVTYVNGNNAFIEDETAGIQLYMSGHGLTAGKKITGKITGKIKLYQNFAEMTSIDVSAATLTEASVTPTVATIAEMLADFGKYINKYIKVEGVTVTKTCKGSSALSERQGNMKQGESEMMLYAQIKQDLEVPEGWVGDVVGIPTRYGTTPEFGLWSQDDFTKTGQATVDGKITMPETKTIKLGENFELGATVNSGAAISYASDNEAVATVDQTGNVTAVAEGTANIKATAPAVEGFTAAEATCVVTVTAANPKLVFEESFEGNSWTTAGSDGSTKLTSDDLPDFTDLNNIYWARPEVGGVKFGTGSKTGAMTTKALDLSKGAFTIKFTAGSYSKSEGTFKVTCGDVAKEYDLTNSGADNKVMTEYTIECEASTATTVTFETTSKRAYLNHIKIEYK